MKNPETQLYSFFLHLLKGLAVTGNDVPPAIENSSYGTEHLGFLGTQKGKLTGNIEILTDGISKIIDVATWVPLIEFEVTTKEETFWVMLHRIKTASTTRKRQKKGGAC